MMGVPKNGGPVPTLTDGAQRGFATPIFLSSANSFDRTVNRQGFTESTANLWGMT